jgi:DNA-3-methyladenine glycosylase II
MDQKIFSFLLKTAASSNHHKLHEVIKTIGPIDIPISNLKFQQYLIKTIVGQQISTKAAASIWKKVQEGLKQIKNFKDKNLHQVLRSCGLSERKALYAQGVLENSQVARASRRQLKSLDSKTYASMLLDLKGVGPWTVEMSRIFYLGDEDVLSEGDYGIQVAHKKMFKNEKLSQDFYNSYAPYRTYVSLYLWQSLDF